MTATAMAAAMAAEPCPTPPRRRPRTPPRRRLSRPTRAKKRPWTLADWFSDPDGDTLTYTAMVLEGEAGSQTPADLPEWLILNTAMGGELTIAAEATDDTEVGTYTLVITASDGDGETATLTATLTVANLPEAPVVVTGDSPAPATLTAMAGAVAAVSWDVSAWFDDPDLAVSGDIDSLEYTGMLLQGSGESQTAEALPAWLALDEETGELTLAADTTAAAVGTHTLAVTASDTTEPTASDGGPHGGADGCRRQKRPAFFGDFIEQDCPGGGDESRSGPPALLHGPPRGRHHARRFDFRGLGLH